MGPRTTQTLTDMLLADLLPKIQHGLHSGKVTLDVDDCENILRLFKVSVSIETLVEHMLGLIHNTLSGNHEPFAPPHDDGKPEGFESVKIFAGDLHADPKKSQ